MNDRELLRRIERSSGQRAGYKQLVRELGLGGGRERRLLLEQLARLTARGQLAKLDRDHWGLPRAANSGSNLVAGRLDLHPDGFGFVRPEAGQPTVEKDIFIPSNEINGAMQGDQVLVELAPSRPDPRFPGGRRMGRIARILTRRNPTVVGIFHHARNQRFPENSVTPFDDRMAQPIIIPPGMEVVARDRSATPHRVLGEEAHPHVYEDMEGLVVDVEITDWPTPTRPARGRILEVLGHEDDFGVDVEIVIRKHHLPHIFPENVLEEAREVAFLDPETVSSRRDFRDLPIVTIDGETARDFDDAVLVRRNADHSYQLQVHIADVAEYVTEASDLDLEARLRGTSVYFPDRAVPMLPQELSSDICSLRPGQDRLVLSCLMHIDQKGDILSYEICEGVIRSARRMTYTQVHQILEGDQQLREEFAALVPEFERMRDLAMILNHKRQRRGSIDFDLPEPIIEFDEFGMMRGIARSTRNWAHRLIEEFMLSANECVASWLENMGVPSLYRIHEKPDPKRIIEFEETAAGFGYSLGIGALPVKRVQMKADRREARRDGRGQAARTHEIPEDIPVTPKMYQKLTAKIAGKPEERILAYLMLRSLKQARYSERNEGHFALAAPTYTHFTSPIRRYPDLIVHRIVKAMLAGGADAHGVLAPGEPHAAGSQRDASFGAEAHGRRAGKHASRDHRHAPESPAGAKSGRHSSPAGAEGSAFSPIPESELAQIATESSQAERRASEAERELVEWKKIKFMRDRVGEDFDAMVLTATKYGLFIELDNLFVEGLVPLDSLRGDRYTYRENTREIIGERHGGKFGAGMRLRVCLDRVDGIQRRLQFSILDEDSTQSGLSGSRSTKARKEPRAGRKAKLKSAAESGKPNKSGRRNRKELRAKRGRR